MVQVPYQTIYSMETLGDEPSLRFEVNIASAQTLYPGSEKPPQISGIPGAIEIAPGSGSSESSQALIPYNVNTQSVRQRFWDGHDWYYRDDLTLIHGNHLWQIGGLFQHNWNFHTRDDNGSGTFNNPVFLVGASESGVSIGANNRPQTCTATLVQNCVLSTQIGKTVNLDHHDRGGK